MNSLFSGRPRPLSRVFVNPPQARQWGSNWGKSKPSSTQPTQRIVKQPTTITLNDACTQLAQAVKTEMVKSGMHLSGGTCISSSAIFLDAVEALGTGANVQAKWCYLHAWPADVDLYFRHMVVTVNGQLYDIGGEFADIACAAEGLPPSRSEMVDILPAGAKARDWGINGTDAWEAIRQRASAKFSKKEIEAVDPQEVQKRLDQVMLFILRDAPGRDWFFNCTDDTVQQARQQVLAVSRSLKDAMRSP